MVSFFDASSINLSFPETASGPTDFAGCGIYQR